MTGVFIAVLVWYFVVEGVFGETPRVVEVPAAVAATTLTDCGEIVKRLVGAGLARVRLACAPYVSVPE